MDTASSVSITLVCVDYAYMVWKVGCVRVTNRHMMGGRLDDFSIFVDDYRGKGKRRSSCGKHLMVPEACT